MPFFGEVSGNLSQDYPAESSRIESTSASWQETLLLGRFAQNSIQGTGAILSELLEILELCRLECRLRMCLWALPPKVGNTVQVVGCVCVFDRMGDDGGSFPCACSGT